MELDKLGLNDVLKKLKEDLENFKNAKIKCGIIGRSGTGKSSLINAIAGEEVAEVGEIETTMNIKEPIEHGGLLFYDLPGCGTSNFPKENYIEEFDIQDFDCVILVTSDRFYEDDLFLIEELVRIKKPVYAVRTKLDFSVDRGLRRGVSESETYSTIYNNLTEMLTGYRVKGIYLLSSDFPTQYDFSKLLEDIYSSLSNFKKERFIADINITSETILLEKRKIAHKIVSRYSALAAANGLNPIPGLDVGVDVTLMITMSKQVQNIYDINAEQQEYSMQLLDKKSAKFIATKVLQYTSRYGGKEAIMLLLKKLSTTLVAKTASKWIPFVGPIIAAGIGFKMTSWIGNDMIKDAEEIAKETFNSFKKTETSKDNIL